MTAVTEFAVFHGASPGTPADVNGTAIRFKKADDDAVDANNPIVVPSAGFAYSWRKSLKLRTTTGPDTQITNLRVFSDGQSLGTGRDMLVATAAAYTQATAADESAAISAVDVDTYTSISPLVINAGQVFGAAETGDGTQDFLVLQVRVGPTASAGNSANAKAISARYDES